MLAYTNYFFLDKMSDWHKVDLALLNLCFSHSFLGITDGTVRNGIEIHYRYQIHTVIIIQNYQLIVH